MRVLGTALLAVAIMAPTVLPHVASAAEWRHYTNDRYGTSIDVPADWAVGEAPINDDGRTFTSPNGRATISVYADFAPVTVTESFSAYRSWLEGQGRARGTIITYRTATRDSFAYSGTKAGRIAYVRVVAGCRDRSAAHHVSIDYPVADKAALDPVVTRVARSLKPGGPDFCGAGG